MATVTTLFPTSNAAETGAGLTNPTNAYSDNASYATGTPGKNTTLATKYGTFGFDAAITAGAIITKVQIIEEHKVSTTSSVATARTYAKVSGAAKANHDDATEPAGDTVKTYDITADDTWTRAKLLDGVFEVVLAAVQGSSSTAVTMSFDYVKVEVTWYVPAAISTLKDNFNDNSFDSAKWSAQGTGGTVLEQNSRLEISHAASISYNYALSQEYFDFTGDGMSMEVVNAGNMALTSHEAGFLVEIDSTNQLWMFVGSGVIKAYKLVANVQTQVGTQITYSAVSHRFIRIRESAGTWYYDTSADGVTWTNRWTLAHPFSTKIAKVRIYSQCWQAEASGSFGYFDSFNNQPATTALNTPADAGSVTTTTPTLNFTGTDPEGDAVEYEVQVDTVNTFDSSVTTIDSYSESNQGTFQYLGNANITGDGQAITGTGGIITRAKWFLLKTGSPVGTLVAKVYAHSGTFGTTSVPTGAALATSEVVDVSTVTGSYSLITFEFSGANRIALANGTNYVVTIEYDGNGGNANDASNYIRVGADITSPTHAGIATNKGSGTWAASAGADYCFYVQTVVPLLDKLSTTDAGFTAGHPFASGVAKDFTVQAGDALTNGITYYWRARAGDPTGVNSYGAWATTRSFTVNTSTTTTKTITGVARVTAATARTESGTARVQKSVTRTESGLARVALVTTKTESGTARVTASTPRTITGKANIRNNTLRTITGVSRIGLVTTKTESGVSRITKAVAQTITGKARVTAATTRTESGVARIQKSATANVTGLSRIALITARTIAGLSRVQKAVQRTIAGVAKVVLTQARTITGKADIRKAATQTESGVARVTATASGATTGKARVTASTSRTEGGIARVQKSATQTVQGLSRIQRSASTTITGLASVITGVSQTINGKARVTASASANETGVARIQNAASASETGIARIEAMALQTIQGTARVTAAATKTISGLARITGTASTSEIGRARIERTESGSIQGVAAIHLADNILSTDYIDFRFPVQQNETGVATLTAASQQEEEGTARIQKTMTRTESGIARVQIATSRTLSGTARVTAATTQTIMGKARVRITTAQTEQGVARITATTVRTITGKARVEKSTTRTITGKARIGVSSTQTETGTARVTRHTAQTALGVARITNTTTRTETGKARLQRANTGSVTGTARLVQGTTKTIQGTAVIVGGATRNITGTAKIGNTTTRNITGAAFIRKYPYHHKPSPYGKKDSPYAPKTSPYGAKTNPYGKKQSPYVPLIPD